jgi:hypothetical protein
MLKEIRLKISTKLICLSAVVALIGCQSNTGSATSSSNVNNSVANNSAISKSLPAAGTISVDALGVLPVSAKGNSSYLMRINNHSKEKYTFQKVEVSNNLLSVNTKTCTDLAPGASCSIELNPHTTVSGDTLVTFYFKDSNGKTRQIQELVRMSSTLHSKSGVSMQNGFTQVVALDGNYSLAMPVQLEQDYESITALNGSLVCKVNNFKAGNSCTYLMNGHALADNTLVNTGLTLKQKNGHVETRAGANVLVRTTQATTLVSTPTAAVTVNNTEVKYITITNVGANPATITNVDYETPLEAMASNNTGQLACGNDLAAGASCSLYFKANPATLTGTDKKGSAVVSVSYQGTGDTKDIVLNTNVNLIYPAAQLPVLNLTDGQQLNNKVSGVSYEERFRLVNSGVPYTIGTIILPASGGLSLVGARPTDTTQCKFGSILATGGECSIIVSFKPSGVISNGTATIRINGKYQGVSSFNYSSAIKYSAISEFNVISLLGLNDMSILASTANTAPGYMTSEPFLLTNTAPLDRALKLKGFTFANTPQGLSINPAAGECTTDMDLNENQANCKGSVVFGPRQTVTIIGQPESSALTISYLPVDALASSKPLKVNSNQFELNVNENAAVIDAKAEVLQRPQFSNQADGAFNDAIDFLALKADKQKLKLRYTFTNNGNLAAERFIVLAGMLPYYAKVDPVTSTCDYAKEGSALSDNLAAGGGECVLDIELPSDAVFTNLNFSQPNVIVGDIQVGYVYNFTVNATTYSNLHENLTKLKRSFKFNREWVNITSESQKVEINPDLSGWLAKIKVKATLDQRLEAEATRIYPLTIKAIGDGPAGHDSLSNAEVSDCEIDDNDDSCTIEIKLDADTHFSGDILYALQATSALDPQIFTSNNFEPSYAKFNLFPYKIAYSATKGGNGYTGDLLNEAINILGINNVASNLSGIGGADLICMHDSNKPAGSKRDFLAALASDERGFSCDTGECVYQPSTTYYNTNRDKMFTTDANGLPIGAAAIEAGLVGDTPANVWLGYSNTEIGVNNSTFTDNCNNWTSSADTINSFIAGLATSWVPEATTSQCNQKHAIMCIER